MSDVATVPDLTTDGTDVSGAAAIDAVRPPIPRAFRRLLLNTLATGVTSSFLWFALTFWVYTETRSVVATGVIGGAYSLASAGLSPLFGTFVDRHRQAHGPARHDGDPPRVLRRSSMSASAATTCSGCAARGSGCWSRRRCSARSPHNCVESRCRRA